MAGLGPLVTSTLAQLADGILVVIRERGWTEPCLLALMPGADVPYDYCDNNDCGEGGMVWVRLVAVNPLLNPDGTSSGTCTTGMDIAFEMGMLVGAPRMTQVGDEFILPTADQNTCASMSQYEQMDAMYEALTCTVLESGFKPSVVNYTPVGPQGGCVGGIWTATIGVV